MSRRIAFFLPTLLLPVLLLGASMPASAQAPAPAEDAAGSQFLKIGVQHYDAGVMADLITRQDAIVEVPPNFVMPSLGLAPALPSGPLPTRPLPSAVPRAANNRLPDGVQRIYTLRSDNSLVIQTAPGVRFRQPTIWEGRTP